MLSMNVFGNCIEYVCAKAQQGQEACQEGRGEEEGREEKKFGLRHGLEARTRKCMKRHANSHDVSFCIISLKQAGCDRKARVCSGIQVATVVLLRGAKLSSWPSQAKSGAGRRHLQHYFLLLAMWFRMPVWTVKRHPAALVYLIRSDAFR